MNNAILYQFLGDAATVRRLAANLTQLSRDHGLSIWLAGAAIMLGWAMVASGDVDAGIAEAGRGIDAWQATGADLAGPYYFSLLAAGYQAAGQNQSARDLVERGVAQAERSGEVWWLAELLRLRASFQPQPESEATLREALRIARRQKARFQALRVACSLAELLQEPKVVREQFGEFAYPGDTEEARRAQSILSSR
jgi:predicted ATPase